MRWRLGLLVMLAIGLGGAPTGWSQEREEKVLDDREAFRDSEDWIYNDLEAGIRAAETSGKPLFVVFRCIPCEACQEFDDDVARRDPVIRDLLDRYICVRIVQANAIDLTRFQYDFDQSFAAVLMHPDGTIYARFGTRSDRPEYEDISLQGLRATMEAVLALHRDDDFDRTALEGKQVGRVRFAKPTDFPSLAKYGSALDYEGQVEQSCIHCHQIRDAERLVYREARRAIPDPVLFPYPDPDVLGLRIDPQSTSTILTVAPGSPAEVAGLQPGDAIRSLGGQPIFSTADIQWVLHNAPDPAEIAAEILREGKTELVQIALPSGWRRGDISWRVTTWELRRMGLGGLVVGDMDDERRRAAGLDSDRMALRVTHVGQYDDHAVAKRAGFRRGDVIVDFDGLDDRMTESELLAYTVQSKRSGDRVAVTVLRDGREIRLTLPLQ